MCIGCTGNNGFDMFSIKTLFESKSIVFENPGLSVPDLVQHEDNNLS